MTRGRRGFVARGAEDKEIFTVKQLASNADDRIGSLMRSAVKTCL